jgi:DUF4097 and DUF4098 domain-containing protein YvlB
MKTKTTWLSEIEAPFDTTTGARNSDCASKSSSPTADKAQSELRAPTATLLRASSAARGVALALGSLLALATATAAADLENNLEKTFSISPGGKFVLDADQGSCEIKSGDSDKTLIQVMQKAKGATKAQADELFANHEVIFQQDGNTVTVIAKKKKDLGFFRSGRAYLEVHYLITLPNKFNLDLKTAGGDIAMPDRDGSVKARTSGGAIRMRHVTGPVEANNAGGDITVLDAGADLSAATSSGSISVEKVHGKAILSDAGGDIHVGDTEQALSARTSSGSIKIKSVKGNLEASDAGGDITADFVGGNLNAGTSSGSIRLGQLKGQSATLRNAGGDISIEDADGNLAAHTTSGSIRIKAARGSVELHDAGGDISIGSAGSVKAETTSGSIKIETAKGPVEAKNAGGNIQIGAAGDQITARTSSGSIKISSAKARINAMNSGGDIEIKAARAAVQATTSSGTLTANFVGQPADDSRLEVSGGSVNLTLPKNAGFNLEARSSGGEVHSDLPVTTTISGKPNSSVLQGKINAGGPVLFVRSSSGDIQIRASDASAQRVLVEDEK